MHPDWSPDRSEIAYVDADDGGQVWIKWRDELLPGLRGAGERTTCRPKPAPTHASGPSTTGRRGSTCTSDALAAGGDAREAYAVRDPACC